MWDSDEAVLSENMLLELSNVHTKKDQAVFVRTRVVRGRIRRNTIVAIFSYIRNINAAVATVCVSLASSPLYRLNQPCVLHTFNKLCNQSVSQYVHYHCQRGHAIGAV